HVRRAETDRDHLESRIGASSVLFDISKDAETIYRSLPAGKCLAVGSMTGHRPQAQMLQRSWTVPISIITM
ncbi:hypothetical protein, partial [Xanthomonas cannabis]|uniref:hypothetical protein n=1 Tax=Xanthomonas cannabis TaxID=1885674 RepID=UPI000575A184